MHVDQFSTIDNSAWRQAFVQDHSLITFPLATLHLIIAKVEQKNQQPWLG